MFAHKFCVSAENCQMMLKINDCYDCISLDKYFSVFLVFCIISPFDKTSIFIILNFSGLAASPKVIITVCTFFEFSEASDTVDQQIYLPIKNKIIHN